MVIVDVYPSTVADHDKGRVELSDLVQQEIFDDEPNEVALVVFNVLSALKHLRELLP